MERERRIAPRRKPFLSPTDTDASRSVSELEPVLKRYGIPYGSWTMKTITDLAREIERKESEIRTNGGIVRIVRTAAIIVKRPDGRVLFEESFGGMERDLPWSIAEKLIAGETFEDAARRALSEELGVDTATLTYEGERTVSTDSPAYPGLLLENTIRTFSCTLEDVREFYEEHANNRRIVWRWYDPHVRNT